MNIMIIHPGTQHSTKLAVALKSHGHEVKLVTTVYNKEGSLINRIFGILPKGEQQRLNARKNKGLAEEDIVLLNEIGGLLLLLLSRIDKKKKIYVCYKRLIAKRVGIKAAKKAVKENYDIVISFDSYSEYPFSYLQNKNTNITCVMDCSAAYAECAKNTYLRQIELYPQLKDTLMADRCVLWNKDYYNDMLHEAKIANFIMCASNYTKKTLTQYGIDENRIVIIPYGYNPVITEIPKDMSEKCFNILYVGGINVMKGIPYLIKAFRSIDNPDIRLTLVGNTQRVIADMCKDDNRIILKGFVPHDKIHLEYKSANLFVFPSLSDGFGFAPLEAMSYGVACAISESCGICDVITDNEDGFIFRTESEDEIKRIINFGIQNTEVIKCMGEKAREKARFFNENSYCNRVADFIERIAK